ncbi:MAG: peptidase [Nitrospirales bacterium]|nr:MAG: peptidase [Nitrospirales bacterium]
MLTPQRAPFGSWKSPLTSDVIVSEAITLGQLRLDGEALYWIEGRPTEGGRNVIVRRTRDNTTTEMTPAPLNVRTRVHEYGGGAYHVSQGVLYFSNFTDQRIYHQTQLDQKAKPVTAEGPYRYADYVIDHKHNRLIGVREDHSTSHSEPINSIVSISLHDNSQETYGQILAVGDDFYASPRLSPNGRHLSWLSWNHPNMPWDSTELWVATIEPDGSISQARCVAGGKAESIFQPKWSPSGVLHFISDRTGWWNIYRIQEGQIEALYPLDAEFGEPQWTFGLSTYAFHNSSHIICSYTQTGTWHLGNLDTELKTFRPFNLPYTDIDNIHVEGHSVYCTASSPTEPTSIIQIDLNTQHSVVLHRSLNSPVQPDYLSTPKALEYPTDDGKHAHAFFYPPHNTDFCAPSGERPPLIVKSHGGPTAACGQSLNLRIQYWTSRGFAVLDVNYGGSTGFGRAYRERIHGQWGVVDVTDCINGAEHLIHRGLVDPKRVAITGGSAGGYTTLCALTFHDLFTGGSSYYGVSDLETLVHDTHKFESRYLDRLVGPYPMKQELYRQRSPIHFPHKLSCPVILFHGLEDKVVPPNQAEKMVEALKEKGIPVAYVAFEGEQHGFRNAKTIKRVLDAELYFYSKIFSFSPADSLEPVHIFNRPH